MESLPPIFVLLDIVTLQPPTSLNISTSKVLCAASQETRAVFFVGSVRMITLFLLEVNAA